MKFNIPDTVFIFGLLHSVEVRPLTEDESAEIRGGYYDDTNRIIIVDSTVPRHLHREIFLHEYAEAVTDLLDMKLRHTPIEAMGLAYHNLIDQLEAE